MTTHDNTPDDGAARAAVEAARERLDTSVVHSARRYNYWLGGKDNFAADRKSGDAIAAVFPNIRPAAIENRRFLQRVVTYLVREAGIRQFLDIGTGLPTVDNTHEVAQRLAPQSRIVYVDNDRCKSGCVHAGGWLRQPEAGRHRVTAALPGSAPIVPAVGRSWGRGRLGPGYQGLRATAQCAAMSSAVGRGSGSLSARHSATDTIPGGRSSRPSKNRAKSARLRGTNLVGLRSAAWSLAMVSGGMKS
jgi:hypothetical protein